MSRTIAIAGGSSPTLGRSIVTAISQTSNTPIILSRLTNSPPPTTLYDAEVRPVDYTSHSSLVSALDGVHTVISVLKIPGPEWLTYQINLLQAAKKAGVKRFAPSAETDRRDFGEDEELEQEVLQGFVDVPVIWDIAAGVAEVPVKADGSTPKITLTDIRDIGRFVAAACELPDGEWAGSMEMVGETISLDEVTELIEEVSGRKLERRPDDREALQQRVDGIEGIGRTREEMVTKMISQINLCTLEEQEGMCILRPVVNRLCPGVRPSSVRQFLVKCWVV